MSVLSALLLFMQEIPADVVVNAPLPGTPQTPATMLVEPAAMLIATFDSDGDARVTRDELAAGVERSFAAFDTAGSGRLRYLAFSDWALRWLGDRGALPSPFEVDRNSDNQVSLDELQNHFSRLFARYDRDGDRAISRSELVTYRTAPVTSRSGRNGSDRRAIRPGPGATAP